jgi:hypothetical protein
MGCSSSVPVSSAPPARGNSRSIDDVMGVSLDYILDFVRKTGAQQLAGLTCYDVCQRLIKPMTVSLRAVALKHC